MAIFAPRTYPEIIGDMLARLISATALTDVNWGSVWTSMLEAAAQEDDEQYFQMLQIIRGFSLDTTTGVDLENRAAEYGLEREPASKATTSVTLGDEAVTKVNTGVYSGLAGAAAGDTTINGDSATNFPTSGSIIIGRGTPNVETIAYGTITVFANYVRFNLSAGLSKDHGTDETIVLSQAGNRLFSAGTVVTVPASDQLQQVSFTLDEDATILDGEEEQTGVAVTAVEAGTSSNVPVGAISTFDAKPFPTATVRNPARVTNGLDEESDQDLRDRIKDHIQSLSRGTGQAIITGVLGLVSESDNKRVVSVSLRPNTVPAEVVKLFVDDGTGWIPTYSRVGEEELVASATGGEKYLDVSNFPLVKAFVETQSEEPYNILNNQTLIVEVGGEQEVVTFVDSDFEVPGAATAYEVLAKINTVAVNFEARVSSGGTKTRIFSRFNTGEEIQVTGGTANSSLAFQTDVKYTSKVYLERNNAISLLSKDGRTAAIESGSTADYDFSGGRVHLALVADGKVNNIIKAWFDPSDFVIPSSVDVLEVTDLINARVPAMHCEPSSGNTRINLSSETLRSAESKIRIVDTFTSVFNEETGVLIDRTTEFGSTGSNATMFGANLDYVYLGHDEVPFDSVYVKMATPASADILPVFEYWNGASWVDLGVRDETLGFTQDGHVLFFAPFDWAKTLVSGTNAYWIRVQRTEATVPTPPIESVVKVCGANEIFSFSEEEAEGADNDYRINRFMGQIELTGTLQAGDRVTIGSSNTRAYIASSPATWSGLVGTTFSLYVDGVLQSYMFQAGDFVDPLAASSAEVIAALAGIKGVTMSTTSDDRIKIAANRMTDGTIQAVAGGANTILAFPTDLVTSLVSHQPALESDQEDFTFAQDDFIIVVVDDNLADNFEVPCYKASSLTAVTSPAIVFDTTLNTVFPLDSDLTDFYLLMTSGAQSGQKVAVTAYTAATGRLDIAALPGAPAPTDTYQLIPKTADHVVSLWNNKQVTLVSTKAEVKLSDGGRRVQLASLQLGEDASISVTGGSGNTQLNFALQENGVDAYRYFTGLAQEVQWTVDGKEDDLDNYQGIRAAGVQVEVIEPVTVPVRLEIDVTTSEGTTLQTITNSIKSAVSNYVNNLAVKDDVILSAVVCSVRGVTGVADAKVTSPDDNIPIADNSLARITEDDIIVG